jgi:hypothetical protein
LNGPLKEKAIALQVYLVIGVLFESVGMGLIIPLVNVIMDPKASEQNFFIRGLKNIFGDISNQQLVFIVLAVLFFLYHQNHFSFFHGLETIRIHTGLSRNVSTRLYKGYLFQPYAFFLDKNSGILMKNVVSEVSAFTGFVQALMYMQTEISVLVGIVGTLLFPATAGRIDRFCFCRRSELPAL